MNKKAVTTRINADTHRRLKVLAAQAGMSIIKMVELLVSEREKTQDKKEKEYVK